MHIILLSGGSGQRLWPLSNDIRSKQFIKIFPAGEGRFESMLQRMYRQIREVDPRAKVTIATSQTQVPAIHNQLGEGAAISVEPCRRDTFPAIALATAYLHDVMGVGADEPVVVCPVDPYVEREYFDALKRLSDLAATGTFNLALLGMEPTYPSEKYGYIIPESADDISPVESFKEKPSQTTAQEYIARGALWNGGVFAYRLRYVLGRAAELLGCADYEWLYDHYDTLRKISFDYAVVEHESRIGVMRFAGAWKDLGTWNTLTEAMPQATMGDVVLDATCSNVHVVNELQTPLLCMGLHDAIVAATPDGILVADKEQSSYIKPHVDAIGKPPKYEELGWGTSRTIDSVVAKNGRTTTTRKLYVMPGGRTETLVAPHTDKVLTVADGEGTVILSGAESPVCCGEVVCIPCGIEHAYCSEHGMLLIEIETDGAEAHFEIG